jgi:PadR family transcriptional regulator, regulatory protein PadR
LDLYLDLRLGGIGEEDPSTPVTLSGLSAEHARSEEALRVEEGSLYPALHRLELAGFLESEWKLSEANRRAKFYRITPPGRKRLAAESKNWARLATGIAKIMGTA